MDFTPQRPAQQPAGTPVTFTRTGGRRRLRAPADDDGSPGAAETSGQAASPVGALAPEHHKQQQAQQQAAQQAEPQPGWDPELLARCSANAANIQSVEGLLASSEYADFERSHNVRYAAVNDELTRIKRIYRDDPKMICALLNDPNMKEWVEEVVPSLPLMFEYLATTSISIAIILHCYFLSRSYMAWQHAAVWIILQAIAWSRSSPSFIAYCMKIFADHDGIGASFWRLAAASVLDITYIIVCAGIALLPSCSFKLSGEDAASIAQRALGLRLVREVQRPVELQTASGTRRSGMTPGRSPMARPGSMFTPRH